MGLMYSLGVGHFLDWAGVNLKGAAGGILMLWDKRALQLVELEVG